MKSVLGVIAALGLSTAVIAGGYKKDIIDTAASAGNFDTLIAAIEAAEFEDKLKGEGPFTVFAPSDEAFAELPEGTLEEWLEPENKEKLIELLSYHVVPGKVLSTDISADMDAVENLAGSELSVDTGEGITINTASVTEGDVNASNGVIHIIDKVIMPSSWPSS